MKKILLLLVLSIELFANLNVDPNVEIMKNKTKIKDGIGLSTISIANEKVGLNRHQFDGYSLSNRYDTNYLAHVSATIDDVSVFDATLSPFLPEKAVFRFGFKDFTDSDDISYVLTDNHGEKIQQSFKIDRKDGLKNQKATIEQKRVKPITLNPKAWEAVTVDSAIEAVFPNYTSRRIEETVTLFNRDNDDTKYRPKFDCPSDECFFDRWRSMPVLIESKIKLTRIAIFSTTTPKPLLAFIQLPDGGFVDIAMLFKFDKSGELFFIGKGEEGNGLYCSQARKLQAVYAETDSDNHFGAYFNLENKTYKKEIK